MVAEGDGGDCGAEFRWLQEGEDEEVAMAMVSVPGAAGEGAPGAANNGGKLLSRKRNLKVPRVSGEPTLKSLQVQVKRLEQQREFLSLLRPVLASDVPDVGAAYADVELQACDGSPVYAHKAVLVSF